MNQESKIQCYQSAYQILKDIKYVKDLCYPEKKRNLEFSCEIGDIHVIYNMRLNTDLLTIRGTKKYPGHTDSQLTEIAKKMVENKEYLFTAYEESITFQLSVTVASVPDVEALKIMNRKTEEFIYFLFEIAKFPDGIEIHLEPLKEGEENLREKLLERVMEKKIDDPNMKKANPVDQKKGLVQEIEDKSSDEPVVEAESETKSTHEEDSNKQDIAKKGSLENSLIIGVEDVENLTYETLQDDLLAEKDLTKGNLEKVKQENCTSFESDKERILFQIEWIAEKNAEIKRKETSLQMIESEINGMREEATKLMETAKKETAYWEKIRDQYEEKNQSLLKRETALSELNDHIKKQERKLNEREDFYKKAKENVDKRTKECMTKESELEKETRSLQIISKQIHAEKEQMQQELEKNRKELEAAKEEKSAIIEKEKKEYESILRNKETDYLTSMSKQKAEYESKLKQMKDEQKYSSEKASEESNSLKNRCRMLQEALKEKDKLIHKLKYDIELYKQSETELGVPDDIIQDFAETRKKNRQLERELEDVKKENIALEITSKEKEEKNRKEKEAMKAEIAIEREALLPENQATEIQQALSKNGIKLNFQDDGGDICLVGERNDCDILINVNKNVIVVRKSVSRPNKLIRKIQEWNESEITETYYCEKKAIVCKKSLLDAEIDVNKVLQKFMLIK